MFAEAISRLRNAHLLRSLLSIDSAQDAEVEMNGRTVILLSSNNYLGLANHPHVKNAAISAIERYGVGAGASRLVSGTMRPHRRLEERLAAFLGTEDALVFNSGYHANLGLITAFAGKRGGFNSIFADRYCHASLIDAIRLSKTRMRVYRHRDATQLERLLLRETRLQNTRTLLVTEGVFSMDGDLAPLPAFADLAERFESMLIVDDAHGIGVLGRHGRGTVEHFDLERRIAIRIGTLGKALGCIGAFVAGPRDVIEFLINTARPFMYSTAPPPALAAAAIAALDLLEREPDRRNRLWQNRHRLFSGLRSMGYNTMETESPIIPLLIGKPELALKTSQLLFERGIYVPAIRPPTIPKGTSRLRLSVMATHTSAHIDHALDAFRSVGRALGIIG